MSKLPFNIAHPGIVLEKPLCVIDCETTGVDRDTDRIIELAVVKLFPDFSTESRLSRFNPQMPIPPKSSEVHGIYDADVADMPTFKQKSKALSEFISGCDIAGFNSNQFDIPILYNEFLRSGIEHDFHSSRKIDIGNIFKIMNPRTLSAAVSTYLGREHVEAHGALPDAEVTLEVLIQQLVKHDELPKSIDELELFSNFGHKSADLFGRFVYNKDGELLINFGKSKGKPAKEDIGFLQWMIGKDFNNDTMRFVYETLEEYENGGFR